MRTSWMPVARVEQVPEPGCFVTLDLYDQPIIVVCGEDGSIRVLSNVCLHRSAVIAQGCGKSKRFRCPYHAWTYDSSGQLVRAPLMQDAQGFDEQSMRLPQIRSEIWNGFVVANLDPEAKPFAPQVAGFAHYFEPFKLADLVIAKTLEYDSGWNWKVLVENFMEAYHHIAIHSKTFQPSHPARDSRIADSSGPWSVLHMPARASGKDAEGTEKPQESDLYAGVIFPHFLLAFQGNGVAWYQVFPRESGHLLLKIHLLAPGELAKEKGFDEMINALADAVAIIHQEDIQANDLVWRGLKSPGVEQGRLSGLEKSIWQLNQWWLEKMVQG